jgi:hypothetical protein
MMTTPRHRQHWTQHSRCVLGGGGYIVVWGGGGYIVFWGGALGGKGQACEGFISQLRCRTVTAQHCHWRSCAFYNMTLQPMHSLTASLVSLVSMVCYSMSENTSLLDHISALERVKFTIR